MLLVIEACQLSHLFSLSCYAQSPFHEFFLPLRRRSADGKERTLAALRGPIGDDFGLTDAERADLPRSGTRFVNRPGRTRIQPERNSSLPRVCKTL